MQIRNRYFVCDTGDGVSVVAVGVNAQGRVMGDDLEGRPYRVLDELRMIDGRRVAVGIGHHVGDDHRVVAVFAGFQRFRRTHQADILARAGVADTEDSRQFLYVMDSTDAVAEALGRIGP